LAAWGYLIGRFFSRPENAEEINQTLFLKSLLKTIYPAVYFEKLI
jgi:hypothetical protein